MTEVKLGFWQFSSQIITPTVARLLSDPGASHAVELGYHNGDLLCPAMSFFGKVSALGMDASDDRETAQARVEACGTGRVEFDSVAPGGQLPFGQGQVDFIYSMHGITRLPNLDAFERVVVEAARVLSPGGVAMFWFGRISRLPFALPSAAWIRGYSKDPVSSVDGSPRLNLRMFHARRAVRAAGMKAVSLSTPLHPDTSWRLFRGGELSYITAWKPVEHPG